jgi:hypothetical protein
MDSSHLCCLQIPRIQEYNQKRFEMGEVRVGRFEILDFVAPHAGGEGDRVRGDVPRFTVTVLDATHSATRCRTDKDRDNDRDRLEIEYH